jgi:hypothetical protein
MQRGVVAAVLDDGQLALQYQDGTAKVLSRRDVLAAIDDSRGPRAEECPVCFGSYVGGAGEGAEDEDGALTGMEPTGHTQPPPPVPVPQPGKTPPADTGRSALNI